MLQLPTVTMQFREFQALSNIALCKQQFTQVKTDL